MLHITEATVELVQFDDDTGIAVLRVEGECPDCEMSAANLIEGIGAHLRARVPEVKDVRRIEIRATP
jgi:Fe-S cluster biogenesis protein NfuA